MMTTYTLHMRDEGGSTETATIEADALAGAVAQVDAECRSWVEDGSWGDDGASVQVWWTLHDDAGDEVADGSSEVEIEPTHDALIRDAGGDTACEHEWTAEGEGGCRENPGVWSVGGTAMTFRAHCRLCGLIRIERSTGSQRNPGEHDTVQYQQPEHWCAECQSDDEECACHRKAEAEQWQSERAAQTA